MKFMDSSPVLGSSNSVCSTASGSSFSSPDASNEAYYNDAYYDREGRVVVFPVASATGTGFSRTRLCTTARPFVSAKEFCKVQRRTLTRGENPKAGNPEEAFSPRFNQPPGLRQRKPASLRDKAPMYNERNQERIYLQRELDDAAKPMYEAPWEQLCLARGGSKHEVAVDAAARAFSDKAYPSMHRQAGEISYNDSATASTGEPKKDDKELAFTSLLNSSNLSMPFPVKHTFIHYTESNDMDEIGENLSIFFSKPISRSRSAPGKLMENDFSAFTFGKRMAKSHLMVTCRPCAYFHNKNDGCRWGAECIFCHLCPEDEAKKRKKAKVKMLKEEAMAAAK